MTMNLHLTNNSDLVDVVGQINNNYDLIDAGLSLYRYSDLNDNPPPNSSNYQPGAQIYNNATQHLWYWDGTTMNPVQAQETWGPWTVLTLNSPFVVGGEKPQYRLSKKLPPFSATPPYASIEMTGGIWNTSSQSPFPTGWSIVSSLALGESAFNRPRTFVLDCQDEGDWYGAVGRLQYNSSTGNTDVMIYVQGPTGSMPKYPRLEGIRCGGSDGY